MSSTNFHPTGDPLTLGTAPIRLRPDGAVTLKDAILALLHEKPSTADEIMAAYVAKAEVRGWPLILDRQNVRRRLSELHTRHRVIRESGTQRQSRRGRPATVWQLAMPLEEARTIVGMNR